MNKKYTHFTGFSLVEMIMVLIIITIIFSFSATTFSRFTGRKKLENEATKIAAVIDTTKSFATTTGMQHAFFVDASAKEYFYYRPGDVGAGETPRQRHRDTIHHIDASVSVPTGDATIMFRRNGSTTDTGDTILTVEGANRAQIDITTNQRTGKVTVGTMH